MLRQLDKVFKVVACVQLIQQAFVCAAPQALQRLGCGDAALAGHSRLL